MSSVEVVAGIEEIVDVTDVVALVMLFRVVDAVTFKRLTLEVAVELALT